MSIASSRPLKAVIVPLLLVAALLTQGLRLCLHVPHAADAGPAHAASIHFESDFAPPADADDDANNSHVSPVFTPLKFGKLIDVLAFAVALTAAVFLFLPRETLRFPASVEAVPALSGGHRFRPPLRAPPR